MRQNNFKRTYVKPETQIILIKNETLLGQASFPSQHNQAIVALDHRRLSQDYYGKR